MARFMKRPMGGPRNVLQEAFEAFDKDGSGKIDRAELRAAMTKLAPAGTTVDETTLTVLMVHVDTNGDGVLDFTEFVQLAYMLKSGGVDVTSIGDDGGVGGGGGGGINPSSSWIRVKCGGREMYMNGDTELMSLKAPADGVKAEASLADEEQFAFMFATAEQCDAGLQPTGLSGVDEGTPPDRSVLGQIKRAFDHFDKRGSGTITASDLGAALRSQGADPSAADLQAVISEYDTTGSGSIGAHSSADAICRCARSHTTRLLSHGFGLVRCICAAADT
jgi:Ca2+-binding EF-hand superfamily protein